MYFKNTNMTHHTPRKILTLSRNNVARLTLLGTGGCNLRALTIAMLCFVALASAGCSKKDGQLAQIGGAEPQRLSFGSPQAVKASFVEKMQACWFNGSYALLGGYQYDPAPALIEASDSGAEVQQIAIYSGKGDDAQVFYVQFHPYNENTLISTRNKSVPPELAARLRRDVETWIFGRNDCGGGTGPDSLTLQNTVQPIQSAQQPRQQQASLPDTGDAPARANTNLPSTAALIRTPAN